MGLLHQHSDRSRLFWWSHATSQGGTSDGCGPHEEIDSRPAHGDGENGLDWRGSLARRSHFAHPRAAMGRQPETLGRRSRYCREQPSPHSSSFCSPDSSLTHWHSRLRFRSASSSPVLSLSPSSSGNATWMIAPSYLVSLSLSTSFTISRRPLTDMRPCHPQPRSSRTTRSGPSAQHAS